MMQALAIFTHPLRGLLSLLRKFPSAKYTLLHGVKAFLYFPANHGVVCFSRRFIKP